MTDSSDTPRPTPDPNRRPADAALGGIASTADGGLADALQRSTERGDDTATGLASTGNAAGGGQMPRTDLGGKNEPGSAPGGSGPAGAEAAQAGRPSSSAATGDAARQGGGGLSASTGSAQDAAASPAPAARPAAGSDESAPESFGRAVAEVVTGTAPGTDEAAKPR